MEVNDVDEPDDESDDEDNDSDENEVEYSALLVGTSDETAEVEFEMEWENGIMHMEFEVEVENALPDSLLQVLVDNILVGEITTDGQGKGELELSSEANDGSPLPANFPPISVGSAVSVGPLNGILQLEAEDDDD